MAYKPMKEAIKYLFMLFMCINVYAVDEDLIFAEAFPSKLSDFKFFKDSSAQIPHEDVIPY